MKKGKSSRRGFSLIELMVSMGILSVLMLLLTILLDQVQRSWNYSESRISQFREARVAFDLLTKNLSQASLNTYWDLKDGTGDGLVDQYYRTSELHFITMEAKDIQANGTQDPVGHAVFFQAPLGFSTQYRNLNNLFNGRGYFVAFGGDANFRPKASFMSDIAEKHRFRLMEFRPPAEANQIFADGDQERKNREPQEFTEWFNQSVTIAAEDGGAVPDQGDFDSHLNPLAENIITLVVSPRDSLVGTSNGRQDTYSDIAPEYVYDSNDTTDLTSAFAQQVPPLVRVTMVAIDETSAVRLESGEDIPMELANIVSGKYFQETDKFEDDVMKLAQELNDNNINHKIFSSMVMLRSAKWSDDTSQN